ncbi:MAG: hypothetical protein GY845_06590 [Planctomycetes bacterium]|nr:hypothetical protein [Planctomycetota bacterium]
MIGPPNIKYPTFNILYNIFGSLIQVQNNPLFEVEVRFFRILNKYYTLIQQLFLLFPAPLIFQTQLTPVITAPLAAKTVLAFMLAALLVRLRLIHQTYETFNSTISHNS